MQNTRAILEINGKKPRPIKNLGWLLRHSDEVKSFEIKPSELRGSDCLLVAHLYDGTYSTPFNDAKILKDWIRRPLFKGVPVVWVYPEPAVGYPSGK